MQNVLILANGQIAKHFIKRLRKSRIDNNFYHIVCKHKDKEIIESLNITTNISIYIEDPTSFLKLKNIISNIEFTKVFIVMENRDETLFSYKNVKLILPKIRIVIVSNWGELPIKDEYTKIIQIEEQIANALYEELPNVPVIAKNIGLGEGEIMEVLVSFGSPYAYRHVGSLTDSRWRVVAIYRDNKQIFPTPATMIKPNDKLIIIGNPIVLEEIYKRITKRKGLFPEPFGRNLYLILDTTDKDNDKDKEDILIEINEAVFLSNKFTKSKLYIVIQGYCKKSILKEIKKFETDYIELLYIKDKKNYLNIIEEEIKNYDIGLVLINNTLFKKKFKKMLYKQKKAIYIFGENSIYNISTAVVLMGDELEMESISSALFDLSETLGIKLKLCNFDPEGEFLEKKNIIEHYETLSSLYGLSIEIEEKKVNPIRELKEKNSILHIAPFSKSILETPILNFFSKNFSKYFLSIKKHPKLLIPIED
jgi:hypothetical protein